MKTRESGMPEEKVWESFFSPAETLRVLGLNALCGNVVEFGCGYGTFTIPAAQLARGNVYALDIEPEMIAATEKRAAAAALENVISVQRDFVADGSGLPAGCADFAMLFNILHAESPHALLREARRVLAVNGILAVMHWNYDPSTPRGPSMDIRPKSEQCQKWVAQAGFEPIAPGIVDLPPYHYGFAARNVGED